MTHIHWVARQNKLETPKEKDEVNKGEVQEYDGLHLRPGPDLQVWGLIKTPGEVGSQDRVSRKTQVRSGLRSGGP